MSTENTATPWFVVGKTVTSNAEVSVVARTTRELDANRIVECVNAMDDVKNPEMFMRILKGIKVGEMDIKGIVKIVQQRDELLELLDGLDKHIENELPITGVIKLKIKSALNIKL